MPKRTWLYASLALASADEGCAAPPTPGPPLVSSGLGVASLRNCSAHCLCHLSTLSSVLAGNASRGISVGKGVPVSGSFSPQFLTAYWM